MKKGKKDGLKEGAKQNAIENAKAMLADGMSVDMVVKYSELSKEEVENFDKP